MYTVAFSLYFDLFSKLGPGDAPEVHYRVRYDVTEVPITLPCQKPPADKPNPKQGIGKWARFC